MASAEMLSYGLLLLCCAGLGITIVAEAAKLMFAGAAIAKVNVRLSARTVTLESLRRRVETRISETRRGQAELDQLNAERARIGIQIKMLLDQKIEIIHEIGTPDGSVRLFACDLRPVSNFSQAAPRQIVFSRDIWRYRNVAHIWAEDLDSARTLAERAFMNRTSIKIDRVVPMASPPGASVIAAAAGGASTTSVPRRPATGVAAAE